MFMRGHSCSRPSLAPIVVDSRSFPPNMFSFDEAIKVSAQHLAKPIYLDVKKVEGKQFVKLCKQDDKVARLFCDDTDRDNCGRRPLSKTSIIERIQKARDEQFYTALKLKRKPVGCTKYTKQAVALAIAMEGTSATITLPSVAGVDGRGMCVLLDKGNQPLWVELAGENLEYLALVVKEELADGSTQRKHARASADEPFESCVTGISQAYALDCIRAVRKDSCGKKTKVRQDQRGQSRGRRRGGQAVARHAASGGH
jgi:hypothetical protein